MEELDILVFGVGDTSFGTEVSQIISTAASPDRIGDIYGSVPLVDLSTKLRKSCQKPEAMAPVDIPATGLPCNDDRARRAGALRATASVLMVDTDEGIIGVRVGSVKGVINMSLSQIEPLPEFLRDRIDTDCIWGIGKLEQELIILLDLRKYIIDLQDVLTAHEVART